MRLSFVSALAASVCACYSQSLSLGVAGGGRLTDDIAGNATSESKRYLVGPEVELGLPFGLAVEVDGIYRREGFSSTLLAPDVSNNVNGRANSWEFPILLKYKTAFPVVKPFVEAGYAPRFISGTETGASCGNINPLCQPLATNTSWSTSHGLVLGGGVQVGLGPLHISPEVRYTRWNNSAIGVTQIFSFHSTQNQLDALVGITWKVR